MARIGIFGGTFNPVHKGHISIAKQMKESYDLDKVLVIPVSLPPHKTAVSLASNKQRYDMCKLAFKEDSTFEVTPLELERGGRSYTIETLNELKKLYPNDTFYLVLGSDMIYHFDLWKDYKKILKKAILLTGARDKENIKKMEKKAEEFKLLGGDVRVIPIKVNITSSTKIRMMLFQNLDVSEYLDNPVEEYIFRNKVYLNGGVEAMVDEVRQIAKLRLTKTRHFHTECVAKQARLLAKQHGADEDVAYLCGYLHDIMKCLPKHELLHFLQSNGILLSDIEKKIPATWHAIAGAIYCKQELGIENEEIIGAVRYHTTGRKDMTLMEKIIFIADATGEDRDYPGIEKIREESFKNLDKASFSCLSRSISLLAQTGKLIHPESIDAYNALCSPKNGGI